MKRREFLKTAGIVTASALTPGFLKALSNSASSVPSSGLKYDGKRVVIVQLSGGNDGLNTVIPFGDDAYYRLRPELSVPSGEILKLGTHTGFHPVMTGFRSMFDNGEIAVINSVGYPNPDRSHFRSMDIWQTGSSSDEYLSTGWIGRYLDSECPSCVNPYSAIEVDTTLALALKGHTRSGMAVKDPGKLEIGGGKDFLTELSGVKPPGDNSELMFLYKTLADVTSSASYIRSHSGVYRSGLEYPRSEFGRDLRTIAELINSGAEASVYYVSLPGFDTHAGQRGRQDRLLKELSEGLEIFADDLRTAGNYKDTVIMCFSEFGRRVAENAGKGTDHGSGNCTFIIGGDLLKAGMLNDAPDLSDLADGDIRHKTDFRSIYSTILRNQLKADDRQILGSDFGDLGFC
ncbi:MAG: DUF1501 domain-containing protein [Ignavibacteria bacterium]|nr:DUF1501 domain-containing protein [Ignavibacteria bacterium]